MKNKILLIEDDNSIAILVKETLERENFFVTCAADIREARQEIAQSKSQNMYDLIILDRKLPDGDGLDFCIELRCLEKTKDIPILFVTAMALTVDKIIGLKVGADDYLTKPFDYEELIARVQAIFRRMNKLKAETNEKLTQIKFKDIILNLDAHECKIENKIIDLWPKEFELLKIFIENKNKVLGKDILAENVWNKEYLPTSRTIEITVQRLRKKLGDMGNFIKTIKGYGFKLEE